MHEFLVIRRLPSYTYLKSKYLKPLLGKGYSFIQQALIKQVTSGLCQ
jgi:hypothetical protein